MRILYLSQYFPPEVGATQTRAHEMAKGLVQAGHQVTMIAEFPNHPHGIIPPEYRGKIYERTELDGIDVIRVWVKASTTKNLRTRLMFYISYMIMAIVAGLFWTRGRYDLIYATSPPLFAGGAAWALSMLRWTKLVFEVRDLWPESAVALGELNNQRAIQWAERLEWACYRRAQKIVVVTNGIKQRLIERGVAAEKLALIPNGANTNLFHRQPDAAQALRQRLQLEGKFVILYAGIHGIAQGLELLIEVAEELQAQSEFCFLFVGEGPEKAMLVDLVAEKKIENVLFHPQIAREEIPAFLSMAQVAVVPLRKLTLFRGALPSKMFDAWACGCPTLITIDGEAKAVLEEADAGIWVEPEEPAALATTLRSLRMEPERLALLGENGRTFVDAYYSRQKQAHFLEELLDQMVNP